MLSRGDTNDRWLYSGSPGPTGAQETHVHTDSKQQARATAFLPLLIYLHSKPKQHIRNPSVSTENQTLSQKPKAVPQSLGTMEPRLNLDLHPKPKNMVHNPKPWSESYASIPGTVNSGVDGSLHCASKCADLRNFFEIRNEAVGLQHTLSECACYVHSCVLAMCFLF